VEGGILSCESRGEHEERGVAAVRLRQRKLLPRQWRWGDGRRGGAGAWGVKQRSRETDGLWEQAQ